jgi:hypothetical protein
LHALDRALRNIRLPALFIMAGKILSSEQMNAHRKPRVQ